MFPKIVTITISIIRKSVKRQLYVQGKNLYNGGKQMNQTGNWEWKKLRKTKTPEVISDELE